MGTPLTLYASLAVIIFLSVTLSRSQKVLFATGTLLGAVICHANHKPSKKAICAIYFDPNLLVSIEDQQLTCIFPRANGCGQKIDGGCTRYFNKCRTTLPRTSGERAKLRAHLHHMVELRLCSKCLDLEGINDCVTACVEKWLTEVDRGPPTAAVYSFEDTPMVEEDNVTSGNTKTTLSKPEDSIQDLPGTFSNHSEPEASSPRAALRTSEPSRGLGSSTSPEFRATDLAPCVLRHSTPTLADAQSSVSHTIISRIGGPSQQSSPTTDYTPTSPKPRISIPGWGLVLYHVKKPETLHERISQDLQQKEIESGSIYILRRDDDEEYFKVGYSEKTAEERLQQHIAKCGVDWEIVWATDEPIKHAKRVERLIHIECGLREQRYQETFCKNGGTSCNAQHREIVKAPYEEVIRCVKYWVAWMDDHSRYEAVPYSGSSRRSSKGSDISISTWKLTNFHEDLKIHDINHEFCQTSTGESWVQSPRQQKSNGRRKSASNLPIPKRPTMLHDTRETQSTIRPASNTPSFDSRSGLLPTPSPTRSASLKSRRSSALAGPTDDAREDEIPDGISRGDRRLTDNIEVVITPETPPVLPTSPINAQLSRTLERSDANAWSRPIDSPALTTASKEWRCDTCLGSYSSSSAACVACLTPEPDEQDPYVSRGRKK